MTKKTICDFNPIIILFLTVTHNKIVESVVIFQSYYSLIFNTVQKKLSCHEG